MKKIVIASNNVGKLNEIGAMPLAVQERLLRLFREQVIQPLGAPQPVVPVAYIFRSPHGWWIIVTGVPDGSGFGSQPARWVPAGAASLAAFTSGGAAGTARPIERARSRFQ